MSDKVLGAVDTAAPSIVASFYSLLAAADIDGLVSLVEANFAEDAVLNRPESLPGGGPTTGRGRIVKFVKGAAAAGLSMVVSDIHEGTAANDVNFFADVSIDLGKGPVKVLEWWKFADGKVATIDAYYWDTAAMLTR